MEKTTTLDGTSTSLVDRAKKMYSKEKIPKEFQTFSIKKFSSWTVTQKYYKIIKRVLSKNILTNEVISNEGNEGKDQTTTVLINIDYPGERGEHLLKKCLRKLRRSTNQKSHVICWYSVTKI